MKFRRRTQAEETVNVTPLIDVVFLLLIFFMVSTTFTRETELSIVLPEADAELREEPRDFLEVMIDADGQYAIDGRVLVNNQMSTVVAALRQALGDAEAKPLVISADANTPHQAVVQAMEAAGEVGLRQLSIATRERAPQAAVH